MRSSTGSTPRPLRRRRVRRRGPRRRARRRRCRQATPPAARSPRYTAAARRTSPAGCCAGCRRRGASPGTAARRCCCSPTATPTRARPTRRRLARVAAGARDRGVTTSTVGIGLGYDELLLAELARGGQGNHVFAEHGDDAAAAVAGEVEGLLSKTVQAASLIIRPDARGRHGDGLERPARAADRRRRSWSSSATSGPARQRKLVLTLRRAGEDRARPRADRRARAALRRAARASPSRRSRSRCTSTSCPATRPRAGSPTRRSAPSSSTSRSRTPSARPPTRCATATARGARAYDAAGAQLDELLLTCPSPELAEERDVIGALRSRARRDDALGRRSSAAWTRRARAASAAAPTSGCENVRRWPRRATHLDVGRHDDEKLRRFLAARRKGDAAGARRWWEELLTDNFDRVNGMVVLESRGRLSRDEQDEALQRALITPREQHDRDLPRQLDGRVGRGDPDAREVRVHRHAAPRGRRSPGTSARSTRPAAATTTPAAGTPTSTPPSRRTAATARATSSDADALGAHRAFLDWAVPQLSPKRRAVIELDRAGVPVEEIQERLGVSRDVVYQSRSRAAKELAKLREEYGS